MDSQQPLSVALFPIPDVVAFPGTTLPLHVFEPRYRQLIHDCVKDQRMVGVSHTVKAIHVPRKQQNLQQALSSNQTTYKPTEVFSAGFCEIVETTGDGRILANINVGQRLMLAAEVQSLPYRIVECVALLDDDPAVTRSQDKLLQKTINSKLIGIVEARNPALAAELAQAQWTAMEPADYSFRIFQLLRFEADVMQQILELQSVNKRLQAISDMLHQA